MIQLWGSLPSDWNQIKPSSDIRCHSKVWRSICTVWTVFIPSWSKYHRIALVGGTILPTIICVYHQLCGENPSLAEIKLSQCEEWHIRYTMTSAAFASSHHLAWTAELDGCTVGTTCELRGVLQEAQGLKGSSRRWCQSNAQRHQLFSPCMQNIVFRLLNHEVPGVCTRWRQGRVLDINYQNSGCEPNRRNSSIFIPSSLQYLDSFFLPYWTNHQQLNMIPAAWTISIAHELYNTMPLVPKHTR